MPQLKSVFIVNPISGGFHAIPIRTVLEHEMDSTLYDWSIVETQYAGHAEILAREYAEKGYDAVFAVGGDGTVNEIGRAIAGTDTALGIIPCGSGNGLARHLGISTNPIKAVRKLSKVRIETIDYGIIEDHPFFCTCGIGFDAQVSYKFASSKSRGLLTYIETVIKEGIKYKTEGYSLEVDGKNVEAQAYIITCANAAQWGNNVYIAPLASVQDGLLDITIVTDLNAIEIPVLVAQLIDGRLAANRNVRMMKCKQVTVRRNSKGVAHCDGDPIMMGKDLSIRIVHNGLKVIVPNKPKSI